MKRKAILLAVILLAGIIPAWTASAGDYPDHPVQVIVPFSAGSATDTIARLVTEKLSELWSQPVPVENKVGAGGTVGAAAVAKAAPDGYTLLIHSNSYAVNPALYRELPYDAAKDFMDIAPLTRQPYVLVVAPTSTINSVADLVAEAKAAPGQVRFGSAGTGSSTHFVAEKFRLAAGIDTVHVPYKGGPEASADVISGAISYWFPPMALASKYAREGKLKALAVTSVERSPAMPDVPTIAESGLAGFEDTSWMGVWAPAGTPAATADRISRDVARALADPAVREKLAKLGAEPISTSPGEFSKFVRNEMESAVRVAKAAGIQQQ